MKGYIVSYILGVASVVAPMVYMYAKGFFKEWVKTPEIKVTVEPKADVTPEVPVDGEAKS